MAGSRMVSTVARLQKLIGYKFKNAQLGWEAVQAPGSVTHSGETIHARSVKDAATGFERLPDGNKRLALVGDSALRLVLCEDWYLGDEVRERLNHVVCSVATNENLNKVGLQHSLQKLINDSPGRIALKKMKSEEIAPLTMASTVEAILGAVYMDGGMAPVAEVMQKLGIIAPTFRKIGRKTSHRTVESLSKRSIAEAMDFSEESVEDAKGPSDVSVEDVKGPSAAEVEEVKSPASNST